MSWGIKNHWIIFLWIIFSLIFRDASANDLSLLEACSKSQSFWAVGSVSLACVLNVNDSFIAACGIQKGPCYIADLAMVEKITGCYKELYPFKAPFRSVGGMIGIVLPGLAALETSVQCKGGIVGTDRCGFFIKNYFEKMGIHILQTLSSSTEISLHLQGTDGLNTTCLCPLNKRDMLKKNIPKNWFNQGDIVYVDGNLLRYEAYLDKILSMAHTKGAFVVLELADQRLTDRCANRLWYLLSNYVDIILTDSEEACVLSGFSQPEKACSFLKNFCEIVVVRSSSNECWVASSQGMFHDTGIYLGPISFVPKGYFFTPGFLYGLMNGAGLELSARFGILSRSMAFSYKNRGVSLCGWQILKRNFEQKIKQ
ncbi:hypothetical protein CLAVI_000677 [Candidatus Clavichlamydia salmonicola]|uniref:carbohydrate kinase family protein n=1 Tax=Candidatus Clavichlamydia salmonicola TaxID=469812 RepID=UPI00189148E2|nr:PfkB family carbohydrate kinase [Candidatus Clavichlamydia salmonicola]MBF5051049.1 hypothetical protein [Candidatus Clavichlamydia salmonicola]